MRPRLTRPRATRKPRTRKLSLRGSSRQGAARPQAHRERALRGGGRRRLGRERRSPAVPPGCVKSGGPYNRSAQQRQTTLGSRRIRRIRRIRRSRPTKKILVAHKAGLWVAIRRSRSRWPRNPRRGLTALRRLPPATRRPTMARDLRHQRTLLRSRRTRSGRPPATTSASPAHRGSLRWPLGPAPTPARHLAAAACPGS